MKSGNLNFLEPSGPLQACNGTDLPLPYLSVCILYAHKTLSKFEDKKQVNLIMAGHSERFVSGRKFYWVGFVKKTGSCDRAVLLQDR